MTQPRTPEAVWREVAAEVAEACRGEAGRGEGDDQAEQGFAEDGAGAHEE
jgi:hypothetical protein